MRYRILILAFTAVLLPSGLLAQVAGDGTAQPPPNKLTQLPPVQPKQLDGQPAPSTATGPIDPRPHNFELRFTAKELEGKHLINSREYKTYVTTQGNERGFAQIRSGSRVPISTGKTTEATSGSVHNDFSYIDLGINIDIRNARVQGDKLVVQIVAEISSADDAGSKADPIIRQKKWDGGVALTPGKTVSLFSSDDVTSRNTIQLEILAVEVP